MAVALSTFPPAALSFARAASSGNPMAVSWATFGASGSSSAPLASMVAAWNTSPFASCSACCARPASKPMLVSCSRGEASPAAGAVRGAGDLGSMGGAARGSETGSSARTAVLGCPSRVVALAELILHRGAPAGLAHSSWCRRGAAKERLEEEGCAG
eukprot:CAMPEP_0175797532 /NCGR_PEP_ID=MMETSP0097-20121207/85517_1 /TAXON_ID=311494 /ORGANISM="Alexandrium monilatum, Strain CCMP3105" /LENGTH=156 /DNA_ID=CAMNT_0017108727 /DNA_START=289 /DNA_END=754 /DNA_ORIENTATION=-